MTSGRWAAPNVRGTLSGAGVRGQCPRQLGGVQFDFAELETEPLNLLVRQNSFEPEDFICQGAMVEHLKLRLFVGFADRGVQRPP